jgi:hypothetical protein
MMQFFWKGCLRAFSVFSDSKLQFLSYEVLLKFETAAKELVAHIRGEFDFHLMHPIHVKKFMNVTWFSQSPLACKKFEGMCVAPIL